MSDFAGGRWTAARYRQFVISALRQAWMKWPCKADALKANRRPNHGPTRHSWIYTCEICKEDRFGDDVQVDHRENIARHLPDMNAYIAALFCEDSELQVVCKGCHRVKTRLERK